MISAGLNSRMVNSSAIWRFRKLQHNPYSDATPTYDVGLVGFHMTELNTFHDIKLIYFTTTLYIMYTFE